MKISVVLPAHNAEPYIVQAIDSCLNQSKPAHEIIVVDDCSTDRTAAIAEGFPPPVRVIRLGQNAGCANARNRGIEAATGDWIALLDADDWFLQGKFEALACCLERNPDAKFLYSGFRAAAENESRDVPAYPVEKLDSMLRYRSPFGVASVLFRRDACLQLGGFDTSLRYAEDWDFFLRFAALFSTAAFACTPEILAVYRIHASSKSHRTMPVYEARKHLMNGVSLHGLTGLSRFIWRRKLNSFLHYDYSIVLREEISPRDLEFVLRSLWLWPIPSEAMPMKRYLVAVAMLKQHLLKSLGK